MPSPQENEDLPSQHYSTKHRIVAWISTRLFDNAEYTVRHGLLKGMKRHGGLGWLPEAFAGGSPSAEHKFWSGLNLAGMTVYDVGAFQGLLALYFASKAKAVVCFEPNDGNRKRLIENLTLNGVRNVQVRPVGVGSARATLKMVSDPLMPGGSSVDATLGEAIKHGGSGRVVEQEISIVTLDEEIVEAGLAPPGFIKIDIEGWEIEALRGARRTLLTHRPMLFLEMHGETMREKKRKVKEIVDFLWDVGYRRIEHIESGSAVTPDNSELAKEGHLFCPGGQG
jgi:FkbM family methyltransferase